MQNEPRESYLLSFGVGAAAGVIAALLLTPLLRGGAGAAESSGELPAVPDAGERGEEPPGGWKAHFSSLVERLIIAIRAGREEMLRVREEWAEKGGADG